MQYYSLIFTYITNLLCTTNDEYDNAKPNIDTIKAEHYLQNDNVRYTYNHDTSLYKNTITTTTGNQDSYEASTNIHCGMQSEIEFIDYRENEENTQYKPLINSSESELCVNISENQNQSFTTPFSCDTTKTDDYQVCNIQSQNILQEIPIIPNEINYVMKYDQNTNLYKVVNPFLEISFEEENAHKLISTVVLDYQILSDIKLSFMPNYKQLLTNYNQAREFSMFKPVFDLNNFFNKWINDSFDVKINFENELIQDTNNSINENNFSYSSFVQIICKYDNYCMTSNFNNVKNAVINILTDKSTSVLYLFPQNHFFKIILK